MNTTCSTKRCRRTPREGGRFCYRCEHQNRIKKNPIKYYYGVARRNAKRRGVPFLLTLEEYTEFVNRNGYMEMKGRDKYSLCMDRIDNNKPYQVDNIRAITMQANSWKRNYVDYWKGIAQNPPVMQRIPEDLKISGLSGPDAPF